MNIFNVVMLKTCVNTCRFSHTHKKANNFVAMTTKTVLNLINILDKFDYAYNRNVTPMVLVKHIRGFCVPTTLRFMITFWINFNNVFDYACTQIPEKYTKMFVITFLTSYIFRNVNFHSYIDYKYENSKNTEQ